MRADTCRPSWQAPGPNRDDLRKLRLLRENWDKLRIPIFLFPAAALFEYAPWTRMVMQNLHATAAPRNASRGPGGSWSDFPSALATVDVGIVVGRALAAIGVVLFEELLI